LRVIDEEKLNRTVPGYKAFLNLIIRNKKGSENMCDVIKFVSDTYRNQDIVKKLFSENSVKCY